MAAQPSDSLQTLLKVRYDWEAAAVVGQLEAQDIMAHAEGGFLAGFRAEAPAEIRILVHARDFPRAQQCLLEWQAENAQEDDSEDEGEETKPGPASRGNVQRRWQWTLGTMLILQAAVSVLLSLACSVNPNLLAFALLPTLVVFLAVTATVGVASDLQRARKAWRRLVWILLGIVGWGLFAVILRVFH